jgi:hypothetical protein
MNNLKSVLFALSGSLVLLAGCTKDPVLNKVPTSNAGPSKTFTLPTDTVTLSGSGADADGQVVAYLWSQVSGPSSTIIVNPGSPASLIKGFTQQGTYVFQLMVTDNQGATGVDTATVIVNPAPASIKTLTLQPNNNTTEYTVANINGTDATGPTVASIEADAWTTSSLPFTLRGFVKFDLSSIPTNAVIKTANLYLYSNPTPNTGNQVDANYGANAFTIQQIAANWSTPGVSWANQPAGLTANQVSILSTAQSTLDLNVDVTAMIASMVNNNTNYGFVLKLQSEVTYASRIFVSSHNATYPDKHPKLVITYQ